MTPFVGRQPELAVLRARLGDALAGRPQIVQIQGPAGMGKTALLEHFLAEVRAEPGPVVVWASGEETEELLAYGVIEQMSRSVAIPKPATNNPAEAVPAAAAGAAAVPDPVDDPVTVGTRLLEFLDRLGGSGQKSSPVILAVDDANWADRPSLQALIFALRRLAADQVLTLIAVRDDSITDLPESLGRLINGQRGTVLRLRGLDEEDLRDLAAELGIEGIGTVAARRLRYGTQGNPLHARALLEEFPPSEWGNEDQLLPSPRSFRRLVQDRYASCAEPTRRLIDAAAVLGPHCALPTAALLAEVTDALVGPDEGGAANRYSGSALEQPGDAGAWLFRALLAAVDEATRHDLLRVSEASSPWTLSFPHPLVRAAVYEAIGPVRRHALHTAAAAVMTDESAVLRHRVAAAAEPDEVLAADLTAFADLQARRQSWESAAAHLVSASRLSPDPQEAQRRVMRAVLWTIVRGDAAAAAGSATEIAGYPDSPLRDVVLGSLAMAAEDPTAAERLLTAAWAALDSGQDAEIAATAALMTAIHWYGRLDATATVAWCERALAAISAGPDAAGAAIRAVAVTYLVHGLGYAGRTVESVAAADSARELPGDADQLWLNPRSARGVLRLVDDDLDAARADLESVAATASRLGILNTSAFSFAYLARAEWVAGAWDDALLHAERAVAINLESDFGFMQTAVLGIAVLVPAGRGDFSTADSYLAAMTAASPNYERSVVALAMSRARVAEARGRPADVLAALAPVLKFPNREAADEPGFWPWQDLYADALVAARRLEEADEFLLGHEKRAEQRGRRTAIARLARARGGLEAAAGRTDQAKAAFSLALDATEGLSVPFERGRIELAAGRFLRRAGQRRRAADLLDAAQQRFLALGAAPYAERCDKELAASGLNPVTRIGRDRAGLTAQELVVARLAGQGRSNREIADDLVVSIKTIEYHLRNAFAKLGVTSRRQLPDRLTDLPDGR